MTAIQLLACAGMIAGVFLMHPAGGIYGQPVWVFLKSQTEPSGRT